MMLDLFAGLGGFSLAAERVGLETVAFCEINPFCRRVLAKHWPGVPIFEDVTQLTAESLRARGVGPITGLTAGWPCQGNSVAGKRRGHGDERSGLFSEVLRLADELRPEWLLLENVPGLVSVNDGDDFAAVIGELRRRGYVGCVRRLDAQFFGLAQRRARLLFVGGIGAAGVRAVHSVLEGGRRYPAPGREAGESVAPTLDVRAGRSGETSFHTSGGLVPSVFPPIGSCNNGKRQPGMCADTAEGLIISPSLRAKSNDPHRADMAAYVTHSLTGEGHDASEDGTGRGTPIVAFGANDDGRDIDFERAPTLRCGGVNGGGVHTAIAFHENISGCVTGEGHARALRRGASHSYQFASTGAQVRRLSPTECERLQGFSIRDQHGEWQDGHTCLCGLNRGRSYAAHGEPCECADSPRYRALGNAVAVPVAEWMLRRIVEAGGPRP